MTTMAGSLLKDQQARGASLSLMLGSVIFGTTKEDLSGQVGTAFPDCS